MGPYPVSPTPDLGDYVQPGQTSPHRDVLKLGMYSTGAVPCVIASWVLNHKIGEEDSQAPSPAYRLVRWLKKGGLKPTGTAPPSLFPVGTQTAKKYYASGNNQPKSSGLRNASENENAQTLRPKSNNFCPASITDAEFVLNGERAYSIRRGSPSGIAG